MPVDMKNFDPKNPELLCRFERTKGVALLTTAALLTGVLPRPPVCPYEVAGEKNIRISNEPTPFDSAMVPSIDSIEHISGLEYGWEWVVPPQNVESLICQSDGNIQIELFEKAEAVDTLFALDGTQLQINLPFRSQYVSYRLVWGKGADYLAAGAEIGQSDRKLRALAHNSRGQSFIGFFLPPEEEARCIGVAGLNESRVADIASQFRDYSSAQKISFISRTPVGERSQFVLEAQENFQSSEMRTVTNLSFEGKLVIIIDWDSKCAPCKLLMKSIFAQIENLHASGQVSDTALQNTQFILINHDEPDGLAAAKRVADLLPRNVAILHVVLSDLANKHRDALAMESISLADLYALARIGEKNYRIPRTLVINASGEVVFDEVGLGILGTINSILESFLTQPIKTESEIPSLHGRPRPGEID